MKRMPWFYNWLVYASWAWFACFCLWSIAQPSFKAAGFIPAMVILGVAAGPTYAFGLWKRVRTGRWVN